jgi:hypothetical protein
VPVEDAAFNCVARPTRSWTLSCLWVGAILSSAPAVVQASPPEYLGHRGSWVESAEHANTPIDDLGQPSIRRGPEPGATTIYRLGKRLNPGSLFANFHTTDNPKITGADDDV